MEKSDKRPHVIKVSINRDEVMLLVCTLDIMWRKWYFTSVVLLLKTYNPPNHEKNIWQISKEEHSTKYLTLMPQNCEGHQKQESLENCHNQEEPQDMTSKCNVAS